MPNDLLASVSVHAWVACLLILPPFCESQRSPVCWSCYMTNIHFYLQTSMTTNPASDPSAPCRLSLSVIQSQPEQFFIRSFSPPAGWSHREFLMKLYIFFSPPSCPGFSSPLVHSFSLSSENVPTLRDEQRLRRQTPAAALLTDFYKDVDFIHSSLPHFICPSVHVLD